MRKILFVFPPLSKNSTELYFRTKQFFQILSKKHEVEIISTIHKTGESWTKSPMGLRVVIFAANFPRYLFKIWRSDTVIIFPSYIWYFWVVAGLTFGKKLILDHYVTALYPTEDLKLPQFLKTFLILIDKLIYQQFDFILTHTETMKNLLIKFYQVPENKIIVIYSLVDIKLFDPEKISEKVKDRIRRIRKIPKGTVAFYHGTYHPFHGVEIIKKAAKILEGEKELSFVLLGWGVEKKSHANVVYIPYQPYEKLPQFLSIADIWLGRFSAAEKGARAASSCMLQAMAMAKSIITAESAENRFILSDGRAGILIEPENPRILAKTIKNLIKDKNKMIQFGKNSREIIIKNFSIEQMEKILEGVFI